MMGIRIVRRKVEGGGRGGHDTLLGYFSRWIIPRLLYIASSHLAGRTPQHAARSASSKPVDHRDIVSHPSSASLLLLLLLRLTSAPPSSALHPFSFDAFTTVRFQRPITIGSCECKERGGMSDAGGSSTCSQLFPSFLTRSVGGCL